MHMKFTFEKNEELDHEMVKVFLEQGAGVIQERWPNLHSTDQINEFLEPEYESDAIDRVIDRLKQRQSLFLAIADKIAEVMGEPWEPIREIKVFVGACPISPRFLDIHGFLLPYHFTMSEQTNIFAHEMIHFLYFKKLAKLFPNVSHESYEYPSPTWVLSEILAVVIGNNTDICKLADTEFELYPTWRDFKVNGQAILEIFNDIYRSTRSFDDFLIEANNKYSELDNRYQITQSLVSIL